ncbi:MAG: hypothetical protein LBU27_05170 [Candidatus Peribacteria bacterium]|nr:hypothetical protein [Candidatus Peribacteria bacterium]
MAFAQDYMEGQVIVVYEQPKVGLFSVASTPVAEYTTLSTLSVEDNETMALVVGKSGESTQELIEKLSASPGVKYVQPNYLYQVFATPNDSLYGSLRGLPNIHRPETMEIFSGNRNATGSLIAVLDLGVDYRHPDLVNQMRDGSNCKNISGNYR